MKKRVIPVIVILFSLMMIGIIAIQAWWIVNAFKLNEQAFDAAVYRSLDRVVAQIQKQENYSLVKKEFGRDSIISLMSRPRLSAAIHHPKVKAINTESFSFASAEDDGGKKHASVRIEVGHNGKKVTIVSTDSSQAIINETADDADVLNLNVKLQNLDTLIQQMVKLKTFDSLSVQPKEIDSILKTQLRQNGLNSQRVDIALLNKDKTYLFKSTGLIDTLDSYKINLYPNDVFGRDVRLLASFPDKFKQISSGIWWAFILSLSFTAALLALFIYSIMLLIRHKNLLAIKNDFISHMSHEFKTPLAGISIGADMIAEKASKMTLEQITKVAQSIKEQSTRLNKDVSSVLLTALVDEKPLAISEPFNVVDVIKQVIEEFKLVSESRNARIETRFSADSIIVNGDRALWSKVISNLLDNSLKFSKDEPLIIISVSVVGNKVILEVSDNGVGIAKEDIPRIFDKFYRSDYRNKSNIQGFGLGLSFVKKVVTMHNGTIRATSETGKGTTIFIELPL